MTTETQVKRFVAAKNIVIPFKTLEKAAEEANDYKFMRAGNNHYVCKHGDKRYVIIEKLSADDVPVLGCSCEAWTHAQDQDSCKHVAAFLKRSSKPAAVLDKRTAMDLIAAGWTKTEHGNLYPPDPDANTAARKADVDSAVNAKWTQDHLEIPPDPDLDLGVDDPLQESEELPTPKSYTRTCKYCKLGFEGSDPSVVFLRHETHEAKCPKNPANQAGTANEGELTGNCQWCGKEFKRYSKANLKAMIEEHEASCPKNPANISENPNSSNPRLVTQEAPEQQTTALSTGREFPDEREFTNAKVAAHVRNRGGFYKNQKGDEIPDSAAMSLYALDTCRISTETILIEKNEDQAKAIVRGHKGEVSVDASVILRFDVLKRREVLKMAKKYPKAILEWSEEMVPLLNLNFTLKDKTPMITLGEHMTNFAVDQEQFADRTAETLARRRVFDMLSGVDWRDDIEVQAEDADAASMGSKKR